jgi:hypothetical protein
MDQPTQPPGDNPAAPGAARGAAERTQRRSPPPDATGEEGAYLAKLREKRVPVAVEMLEGTVFRGVIEYYDRDMIKINCLDGSGPHVFVRKKHVRMFWEEPGAPTT